VHCTPFFIFVHYLVASTMKKNIVLFVLFVLPIVAYLFFASGVNSFTTLPIITPKVADFGHWKSLKNEKVSLDNIDLLKLPKTAFLCSRKISVPSCIEML